MWLALIDIHWGNELHSIKLHVRGNQKDNSATMATLITQDKAKKNINHSTDNWKDKQHSPIENIYLVRKFL
jgi:hypothetical protein